MDKPISLLVVDDDAGMIQTLNYVFAEKGYEVVTLNHGAEAIELVKKRSFDIIFSDLKMPGMNGVEMVRQIKRVAPETSFVMITAYTMHELVEEAKKEGVQAIFAKPLDLDTVISFIDGFKSTKPAELRPADAGQTALHSSLEAMEAQIKERDVLIEKLQRELDEKAQYPAAVPHQEQKSKQGKSIAAILNQKQFGLFEILNTGEKDYQNIFNEAAGRDLGIRDMDALRLQLSRLSKKLEEETGFAVKRIRRNKVLYFTIDKTV